jgi:hypothetical protein
MLQDIINLRAQLEIKRELGRQEEAVFTDNQRSMIPHADLITYPRKGKCDFVVVFLHWETENVFYPSPKQIKLAHKLIDHGATLILGHHPHVLQGIEKYKNGLIAYSLGNFQFDCKLSQSSTNDSIILEVNFDKSGITDYLFVPIIINENYVPVQVEGKVKEKELDFIYNIFEPLINQTITNKWWFKKIGRMSNDQINLKFLCVDSIEKTEHGEHKFLIQKVNLN